MKEGWTQRIFWMEPFMLFLNKKSMIWQTSIYRDRGKEKAVANFKPKYGIIFKKFLSPTHFRKTTLKNQPQKTGLTVPVPYLFLANFKSFEVIVISHWISLQFKSFNSAYLFIIRLKSYSCIHKITEHCWQNLLVCWMKLKYSKTIRLSECPNLSSLNYYWFSDLRQNTLVML